MKIRGPIVAAALVVHEAESVRLFGLITLVNRADPQRGDLLGFEVGSVVLTAIAA